MAQLPRFNKENEDLRNSKTHLTLMYTINFPRTRNWLNKGWKFSPLHSTVADLTSQDKLLKSLLAKRKSHNFADFLQHSIALPGKT